MNNQITIIDNLCRGRIDDELNELISKKYKFSSGDLIDKKFFATLDKGFEYIYHFAAVIGVKKVIENPDQVLHDILCNTEFDRIFKKIKFFKKDFIFFNK